MSAEFFTTIGVGVSTTGFLAVLILYLANQSNRRMDRLEDRIDRLEHRFEDRLDRLDGKFDALQAQVYSIDKRLSKVEWIVGAEYRHGPEPPATEAP